MSKYTILILLNAPLALYGLFNVFLSYKLKRIKRIQTAIRIIFWLALLIGICFAKPITDALHAKDLTDSPPLSIFDVFLATGVMLSFLLVIRAYARVAEIETRFTHLHERLSIMTSESKLKK